MQLGTTKSTYVENRDVHERRASQPSTISRDIKRVFTKYKQHMAKARNTSVSGIAAQGPKRIGLDSITSSNI